jgi:hypothetical protein
MRATQVRRLVTDVTPGKPSPFTTLMTSEIKVLSATGVLGCESWIVSRKKGKQSPAAAGLFLTGHRSLVTVH